MAPSWAGDVRRTDTPRTRATGRHDRIMRATCTGPKRPVRAAPAAAMVRPVPAAPSTAPSSADLWCAGLAFQGTRALPEPERRALSARLERARRRLRAVDLAAAALVLGASGAAAWIAAPRPNVLAAVWAALLVPAWAGVAFGIVGGTAPGRRWAFAGGVLLLLAIPAAEVAADRLGLGSLAPSFAGQLPSLYTALSLLGLFEVAGRIAARVRFRRALATARDELAASNEVWVFGGPPPAIPRAAERPRIEVLPRSHLFVRGPSGPPRWFSIAPVRRLAPAQPFALRVPIPGARAQDPQLRVHRRSLSPAERSEIAGQAGRLRRHLWPVLAAYTACAVQLAIDALLWGHRGRALWFSAGATFWYAMAAAASLVYAGRLRAAGRLAQDAGHPWMVTIDAADAAVAERAPHMEVLPVSRLIWTERGRPAAWRLQPPGG